MAMPTISSTIFFNPSFFCGKPPKQFLVCTPSSSVSFSLLKSSRARPKVVACSKGKDLEQENSSVSSSAAKEASFDLKLPRRSLLVQFTCNACGERTQRTVNRVAYERGTVFVQCAGCLVHHKLVDNLGLVVEYDLRQEMDGENDSK